MRPLALPRSPERPLLAVVLLAILALVGCTDGAEGDEPAAGPDGVEDTAEPAPADDQDPSPDNDTQATAVTVGHVQDLWVYERVTALRPDGTLLELTDELVAALDGAIDDERSLLDGANFRSSTLLDAQLLDPDGAPRDDVEVVAGLLATDVGQALAVLASPDPSADGPTGGVGFADRLSLDLTVLESAGLAVGDTLVVDHAFAQALPPTDAAGRAEAAGVDAVDRLAAAFGDGRVRYLAVTTGAGVDAATGATADSAAPVAYVTGHLGTVVAGSTRGVLPAKSQPLTDGLSGGLDGCKGGLKCVADLLSSIADGASKSWESAWRNVRPDPGPDPEPEPCWSPPCARSTGEPHLTTFDGRAYDMQGVGEFVLVRTEDLEVHKRTTPWQDSDAISAGTALAIGIGDHRISFDQAAARGQRLRIDGQAVATDELRATARILPDGATRVRVYGDRLVVRRGDQQVTVLHLDGRAFLDVYVQLGADPGETRGLLGTASGSPVDDHTRADNEVYPGRWPDGDFYPGFVDTWRITDATSLFDYPPGLGTADYTDLRLPTRVLDVDDLDAGRRGWAEQVCELAGVTEPEPLRTCVFDVGFSEDAEMAGSARTSQVIDRVLAGTLVPPVAVRLGLVEAGIVVEEEVTLEPLAAAEDRIRWTFDDDTTAPTDVPASVTVTPIGDPNGLPIFEVTSRFGYALDPVLRISPFASSEDPDAAVEADAYVEFELAPTAGPVTVERFWIAAARGARSGESRGLQLRSSVDGFATPLWVGEVTTIRPELLRYRIDLTGTSRLTVDRPVTFRIYLHTPGVGNTLEFGDLGIDLS